MDWIMPLLANVFWLALIGAVAMTVLDGVRPWK